MKKIISLFLVLAFFLLSSVGVFAAETSALIQPMAKEQIMNSEEFLAVVNEAKAAYDAQKSAGTDISRASAPPVTHINVYAVVSPNGGQEIYGTSSNPSNTANDHGGAWIQCVTFQIGYDNFHQGVLGNILMTNDWSEVIDLNGDGVGDAWVYSYVHELASNGGQFVSTVQSANNPWNIETARINIR